MTSLYDHWLVGLSVTVAVLVSYTALRLAARVAANEGYGAQIWIGIGDQPRLMDTQSKPAALERS